MIKYTSGKLPALASLLMLFSLSFAIQAHEKPWKERYGYSKEFVHGIAIKLNHKRYYFRGPAVDPNNLEGATDIPGHEWIQVGKRRLLGKHYNSAPNTGSSAGIPQYWTTDIEDGGLLWYAEAVIDEWTAEKALDYYLKGYVRYSALLDAETKEIHPKKVAWLKHAAATEFNFNGDIPTRVFCKIEPYDVKFGIDFRLCPNWMVPHNP